MLCDWKLGLFLVCYYGMLARASWREPKSFVEEELSMPPLMKEPADVDGPGECYDEHRQSQIFEGQT